MSKIIRCSCWGGYDHADSLLVITALGLLAALLGKLLKSRLADLLQICRSPLVKRFPRLTWSSSDFIDDGFSPSSSIIVMFCDVTVVQGVQEVQIRESGGGAFAPSCPSSVVAPRTFADSENGLAVFLLGGGRLVRNLRQLAHRVIGGLCELSRSRFVRIGPCQELCRSSKEASKQEAGREQASRVQQASRQAGRHAAGKHSTHTSSAIDVVVS